jgi:PAS domain S-box-containing protein
MINSRELLVFFDSHGRILECNEKAIKELGYGDDIYRLPIYYIFRKAFVYQEKQLKLDLKYQNSLSEAIAYRKNQTCFPVELKVSFINDGLSYIGLCSALDITERQEMDREVKSLNNDIKNLNKVSSELVANVTHELRTPINGIVGFSNNLLNTPLNEEQLEAVNIIKRCCINMNMIINDLLDLAKISNNKLKLEQRKFNFRSAIQEVIDVNKARINEKGLKLLVDISDEIPETVIGDEHRLAQVLNNLFSNAIKFTSVGSIGMEVSKISDSGPYIELFFMLFDTGIGISGEEMEKLFKSFSQVDSSITRRFGGTGLGLAIAKKLVEAMGGTITVDSEKNKGSTFSFSVRLKTVNAITLMVESEQPLTEAPDIESINEEGDNKPISEIDYVSRRLQDPGISSLKKTYTKEMVREVHKDYAGRLEKLTICVEMENWETAEELAGSLKNIVPKEHIEVSKNVLRLLLAIRKENHDASLEILSILKQGLHKEDIT